MIQPANNGLDEGGNGSDGGIGEITGLSSDMGRFRGASLKNIAVSAPYMHDGRLATLEAVIDHYDARVKAHPALDQRLKQSDGSPARLSLSVQDRAALVAFLHTLTDEPMLRDERFSDPFARATMQ